MAKGPNKKMVNRATVVLTVFVSLLLIVMTGYMAYYQIVKHDFYQAKAITQQTMDTEINANRGTIFDRNGVALALSATVETVFISPASVKDDEQAHLIALRLSEILGVDQQAVYEKAKKTNYYEVIKRKVEKDVADEVRNLAEKTMASTADVASAIRAIQESATKSVQQLDIAVQTISQATDLATQSGDALSSIVNMAEETADQVRAIAAASEEQSASSEEITQSIGHVTTISGETAEAMRQSSEAVAELTRQTQELSSLVAEMKRS